MNQATSADKERRALRVLRTVGELHELGFQRLRIVPGMSSTGLDYRCAVTPVDLVSAQHGAMLADPERLTGPEVARYSTGASNEYFGWTDRRTATARGLAETFVVRFPRIAEAGRGEDWPYAGWFVQMLGLAEQGGFPLAYGEHLDWPDRRFLPTTDLHSRELPRLPMPPPGRARPHA